MANKGPWPMSGPRRSVLVTTAATTGTRLRGRHSNSSSSTASSTEASGALKVAAMPAAAPATSSVLRSSADRCSVWARTEPTAPPVMMIGPSAPNGPPVPMLIAAEMGLRTATRGSTRLPPGEDRLDRLGHAVAADLLGAEPGHQADDEPAGDGRQQDEQRLVVPRARRHQARVKALVEDEVGDEADQPQQRQSGDGPGGPDRHRARRDREHARAEREVAQVIDALSDRPTQCVSRMSIRSAASLSLSS